MALNYKEYKLAIFDFDGTICATHEAIIHCFLQTFNKLSVNPPDTDTIHHTINKGIDLATSFKSLNPALTTEKEMERWVKTYREIYQNEAKDKTYLFQDAKDVFKKLHSSGLSIVIVSNKGPDAINSALDYFDLKKFTTLIIGDTKDVKKKPDPMIYEKIIKPNFEHIPLDQILVIGDTMVDILFAHNLGVDSCWASYGYGQKTECEKLKPTYTINGLIEICSILS